MEEENGSGQRSVDCERPSVSVKIQFFFCRQCRTIRGMCTRGNMTGTISKDNCGGTKGIQRERTDRETSWGQREVHWPNIRQPKGKDRESECGDGRRGREVWNDREACDSEPG